MNQPDQLHTFWTTHRKQSAAYFPIIVFIFLFIGWGFLTVVNYPYDGILQVYVDGVVGEVDPNGPTNILLQPGDMILTINGVPWKSATALAHIQSGDRTQLEIIRNGQTRTASFVWVSPTMIEILRRTIPLWVALVFAIVSVSAGFSEIEDLASGSFMLFFLSCSALLVAGTLSAMKPIWMAGLFNILMWLIGPLAVVAHLRLLNLNIIKNQRVFAAALFILALLGGLLSFLLILPSESVSQLRLAWSDLERIFLALNMLIVVGILIFGYRKIPAQKQRNNIRIITLGTSLSVFPIVLFFFLPEVFLGREALPYDFAFIFLAIFPLAYGYIALRARFIRIEKYISAAISYLLVSLILVGTLILTLGVVNQGNLLFLRQSPWVAALFILLAAMIFEPMRAQLQKLIDKVFYGGWYDYRSVIVDITQDLEQVRGLNELAQLIGERMHRVLRLQGVGLLLRDSDDVFSVAITYPSGLVKDWSPMVPLQFSDTMMTRLANGGFLSRQELLKLESKGGLEPQEEELLLSDGFRLWTAVLCQGKMLGLMALGDKYDGSVFSGDDFDLLQLLARQIGTAVENLHLLARLHRYAVELETRVDERTRELHEAIERVEAIIASVGDGVVVTDLNGDILSVNKAFEMVSGFSTKELEGTSYYDLLDADENPSIIEQMHASIGAGDIWSGELRGLVRGNKMYDIHLTMSPIRDQIGSIMGYVGSQRDITRQKKIERIKDRFVADVSHELRTPITNICLYLDLLGDAPPRSQERFVTVLKEQAALLRKMVDDILNLNRFALEREAKFTYIDLGLISEQVVASHAPLAERSDVSLSIEKRGPAPLIWGDFEQIARLVANLISNAIRYSPAGHVSVVVMRVDARVCLEVSDNGIGIEPDDLPYLFERFYRGKRVRQSKVAGTGLGLAIVKGIVELHQGTIEVESEVGRGTKFCVYLPIQKGDDDKLNHPDR